MSLLLSSFIFSPLRAPCNGDGDGTFTIQKTNGRGHRELGRALYAHMDMIQHQMTLQNTTLFGARQFVEEAAKLLADLAKDLFPTHPGDKHNRKRVSCISKAGPTLGAPIFQFPVSLLSYP